MHSSPPAHWWIARPRWVRDLALLRIRAATLVEFRIATMGAK